MEFYLQTLAHVWKLTGLLEVKRQKNLPSCLSKVCLSVKIFVSRKEVAVSPRPLLSNVVQTQGIECWRIWGGGTVAAASHLQTSTRPTQTRCSDSPKKCLSPLQIWKLSLSFSESSVTELVWVKMCICARWWASPKLASPKTLERKWGLVTGPGTRQDRRNTK